MFLIEAIIELLGALFGDQQPQAKVGPRDRGSNDAPPRRGPYDYGDGQTGGGHRPKTLAELLEEARREAQGGGARPAAPAPASRPAPPPAPIPEIAPRPRPAPAPVYQAPAAPPRPQPQPQPPRQRSRRAQVARAEVVPGGTLPPVPAAPVNQIPAYVPPKEGAGIAHTLAPWIRALRTSKGKQKRIVGAQALMSYEIFGPPRSRRPLSPGQREI